MNPLSVSKKMTRMATIIRKNPAEWKYLPRWLYSKRPGNTPLNEGRPWITYRAIDWIDQFLTPQMSVFEYGAGGSTIYFSKRVRHLVSVEHDRDYFLLVETTLKEKGVNNCTLILRQPEPISGKSSDFRSSQAKYQGLDFERYVRTIDTHPENAFDLIMIDGRARVACVRQALAKIKPGGALVLDNSNRPPYAEAREILAAYPAMHFAGVSSWNMDISQTSIWRIGVS